MFDDSTFDDSQGHINHHDNSIPKIVSKRSVSDNSNYEPSWWERIKRSVKNMFGYEEEQHPVMEEQKSLSPEETLPVLVNDNKSEKTSQRKSRQTDDNDDEDEDEDDNEIASGDGNNPSENWGDSEVSVTPPKSEEIPSLPDVSDSKYCEYFIFKI